ncbi:family 20 glycosylhydrolase [Dyella sp. LX-66]|uniref:glycoside hydrolase family 20 protein n=1 Tax=unclassified Dyella TaxID=2634549 RepID=UPI001BE0B7B8|nr:MULTISPECIES: family 20 glycosylhydrolase [unclassified Dyella]MBT2119648.1 family 20 glycosylhydrolase [Dyella sp. LX-1]MBT2142075.1 family 20 glycosylhydrolase [Dyella sp. LX-66]
MRKHKVLRLGLGALALAWCAFAHAGLALLPYPKQVEEGKGSFVLDKKVAIEAPADARSKEIASFLHDAVQAQAGLDLPIGSRGRRIALQLDPQIAGEEAYRLDVTPRGIEIRASTDKGLFWGVQTLRQLLPADVAGSAKVTIPTVRIEDAPAFVYRGHMLDVGRHFYPVSFIEKQLDLMSYYKLNVFRWHLTEDQGWRIEIKRYPKLTEVGAWRTEADGSRYGGFYTQDQIREVVEYARQRNIMVIPEIEMPGHSSAAIAAYPELSCAKKPIPVQTGWGVFSDVFCPADENVYVFLQNVLDEVLPLFPSPYVHIGGDEVPAGAWSHCEACDKLIRDEGLENEAGLQSYFIRRMQVYLAGKGKTMIGWDEVLEGGVDSAAVVEVWRGDAGFHKAFANGNRVVNASPYYLDSPLSRLSVEKLYLVDPLGDADYAQSKLVLGAEAPLWSERADPLNAEQRLYPRLLAFAERLWRGGSADAAAYADFHQRLAAHYPRLDAWQVAYGPEDRNTADYTVTANAAHDGWQVSAQRGFDDVVTHYTTDGSEPTAASPSFTDVLDLKQPGTLRVVPFRRDRAYDHPRAFQLERSASFGAAASADPAPDAAYSGHGAATLTDGVLGSGEFKSGAWLGWEEIDPKLSLDLGSVTELHEVSVGVLQQDESWIWWPRKVRFAASEDGKHWTTLRDVKIKPIERDHVAHIQRVAYTAARPFRARYLRVELTRHPAEDQRHTWTFVDEILAR